MADFWGIESTGLEQPDDQLGVSLILANSAEGLGIVSRLNVRLAQVSLEAALPRNPMLEKPTSSKNDRADVWEGLYLDGMLEMMRKKRFLLSPAMQVAVKVKSKIRSLLGK